MSRLAMEAAVGVECPTPASQHVLLIIAWFHNWENGDCYPSYESIAAKSGLSRRTVATAVAALIGAGILSKHLRRRRADFNSSNQYTLNFLHQGALPLAIAKVQSANSAPPRAGANSALKPGNHTSSSLRSEEVARPKARKPRSERSKPTTRMREDWRPNAKGMARAADKGFDAAATERQIERFRLHWLSKGIARADWNASWYTWLNNEIEYAEKSNAAGANSPRGGRESRIDGLRRVHAAAQRLAEERRRREGGGEAGPFPPLGFGGMPADE